MMDVELRKQITYFIGKEIADGYQNVISPLYISKLLNVPLKEVEAAMKEMGM